MCANEDRREKRETDRWVWGKGAHVHGVSISISKQEDTFPVFSNVLHIE